MGSEKSFSVGSHFCLCVRPEKIVLVYVEKFEGRSLMAEMLGDAEMSTLRDVLRGSEYQEALDKKAQTLLDHYKKSLEEKGLTGIKTVIKRGHPAEEILNAVREENAEVIVIGSRGKRTSHLFMGSVSREVVDRSEVPVLLVK
ncbi:MAG: universal stress protein family [Nitrospirae bacterium]|nr:universal stress protein family [Nitrospirota bacterium]MBS1234829.1 universal stress protein family [Nitrospirota bacterium]